MRQSQMARRLAVVLAALFTPQSALSDETCATAQVRERRVRVYDRTQEDKLTGYLFSLILSTGIDYMVYFMPYLCYTEYQEPGLYLPSDNLQLQPCITTRLLYGK